MFFVTVPGDADHIWGDLSNGWSERRWDRRLALFLAGKRGRLDFECKPAGRAFCCEVWELRGNKKSTALVRTSYTHFLIRLIAVSLSNTLRVTRALVLALLNADAKVCRCPPRDLLQV